MNDALTPAAAATPDVQAGGSLGAEVLHLYAQPMWHFEAYISGGRASLLALRSAIDVALTAGTADLQVFAADGEGYDLHVVCLSDADAGRQVVPYTDEVAREPWANAFGPWDVVETAEALATLPSEVAEPPTGAVGEQ